MRGSREALGACGAGVYGDFGVGHGILEFGQWDRSETGGGLFENCIFWEGALSRTIRSAPH